MAAHRRWPKVRSRILTWFFVATLVLLAGAAMYTFLDHQESVAPIRGSPAALGIGVREAAEVIDGH